MGVPTTDEKVDIYVGEWEIELEFKDDETPVDLTIYSEFKAQWRVKEYNPVNVQELEVVPSDLANGKLRLRATIEQTEAMKSDGVIDVFADGVHPLVKFKTAWDGRVTK